MTEAEKHDHDHSSSDEHEHEHDENCNHDHGHDQNDAKGNRGEKKFKKAMGKMGLKQVTGINRVTIKKGKAVLFLLILSLLLVLMILMCGNHPELKVLTLSSENLTLMVWVPVKTKSTNSPTQSTLKD